VYIFIYLICLLPIFQEHNYGWDAYPPNYVRDIYSSDMSQRITVPAVPVARLTNQQQLPILCTPINKHWLHPRFGAPMPTASNYQYELKPNTCGSIVRHPTKVNAAYFVPNDNFRSMGLINVTATNNRNTTIIGQIHFEVRNP